VNIYPIVTGVLGLKITAPIDGTSKIEKKIIQ